MAAFLIKNESKINGLSLYNGDFVLSGDIEEGNFGEARYPLYYARKKDIDNLPNDWIDFPKDKIKTHSCNFTQLVDLIVNNK